MSDRNVIGRIKNLYLPSTEWTSKNPVLAAGEIGIESDTRKLKIGDGSSNWTSLGYVGTTVVDNLTSTAVDSALSANQGKVLNEKFNSYVPNTRTINGIGLGNNVTLYTGTMVSDQVLVSDGTSGAYKSSGFTIASNVPANAVFTDTKYTSNKGITLTGTTFGHTNNVTAGSATEGGASRTLAYGGSFNIPQVNYDANGHITSANTVALTMPAAPSLKSWRGTTVGANAAMSVTIESYSTSMIVLVYINGLLAELTTDYTLSSAGVVTTVNTYAAENRLTVVALWI